MTTTTVTELARPSRPTSRIGSVVRLHLVNKASIIGTPLIILGFILLVNVAIWAIIAASVTDASDLADAQEGLQWSGASFYLFIYMMVLGILGVSATFPLALGFSVTRRDFYLGTAATWVLLSVFFGAVFTLLAVVETATGGWGLGGRMFTAVYFGDGVWYQRFLLFTAAFLFFFFFGTVIAAIYSRWRVTGTLVFFGILTVLLVALAFLATVTRSWPEVGNWFVVNGAPGLVAWSLVPTVISAVAGYAVLRRATPRG
ncbi:ABC transporter permease [Naasia lichenicola]|uniref:ABC transporter permease n=1 Tax=Naasia lichenicola TaxID=2565933 RepID=A0A4S4FP25_9MICO|nr:ABC transporter permease [Naasia lichenicola]THG32320.1 ABC transporter permease [Naasia lichenicola]